MKRTKSSRTKAARKKKKDVSLLSLFLNVILIVLLIIAFTIRTNEGTSLFGARLLQVLTGSMEPVIPQGSTILVKDTNKIVVGDVITFHPEGSNELVTHRVTEILDKGEAFETKGDANNTKDRGTVKKKEILGKYVGKIPFSSQLNQLLKTPQGWFKLILTGAFIVYLKWFVTQLLEQKRKEEKRTKKKRMKKNLTDIQSKEKIK